MQVRERAVQFGEGGGLVGVLSQPRGPAHSSPVPALVLLNAGILHHVGPSRVHVTLARALAAAGFTSLRFDFSGIGDSEPRRDGLGFDDAAVAEVREALDFMSAKTGLGQFVVGGICAGADASFGSALLDDRIVGLLQVDGYAYRTFKYYLHRYAPRLLRARSWAGFTGRQTRRLLRSVGVGIPPETGPQWTTPVRIFPPREDVERGLRALVDRGVQQLHVYTGGQEFYQNYADQFWDNFRTVDFRGMARVRYLAQADHTFTAPDQQALLIELVVDWMQQTWLARDRDAA